MWVYVRVNSTATYGVEAVVDEVLQVLTHADLSHQLVLVAVHASQLTHVGKHILQAVRQLQHTTHVSTYVTCSNKMSRMSSNLILRKHRLSMQ